MSGKQMKWLTWLPVLTLCLVIFLQSCFPSPDVGPSFHLKDKVLHMVVYGLLAVLVARACRLTWPGRLSAMQLLLISVAFSTLYGLSDEWHQTLVASRHGSLLDALADFTGGVVGALLYVKWVAARNRAAGRSSWR